MPYKEKKCRVCGQPFVPISARQADCNRIIVKICAVCGKEFEGKCSKNDVSQTCSKECQNKFASLQRQRSYSSIEKICELCGKPFRPISNTQKICNDIHYRECNICGKQFILDTKKNKSDWPVTCSRECADKLRFKDGNPFATTEGRAKIKQTLLSKYGVEHPAQAEEVRAKMRATNKERYGSEYYAQSDQYIKQTTSTNLEKYGTEWPIQNKEILAKARQTTLEHYGVENPMKSPELVQKISDTYFANTGYKYPFQNPDVQAQIKETTLKRYGVEHYSQTSEFLEKFKQTSLDKYGVQWPTQNEFIRAKTAQTCLDRYGATSYLGSEIGQQHAHQRIREIYGQTWFTQTAMWKRNTIKEVANLDEWMKFVSNPVKYVEDNFEKKPTYREVAKHVGVRVETVCDVACRKGLLDKFAKYHSTMEAEVADFLKELNVDFHTRDRQIINPLEIDIVVDSARLGIECNPTVTHNSSIKDPWGGLPKSHGYHQIKTNKCDKQGLFLFHIFGYEWEHKQDIIKSMLRNVLGKNTNVIYARKCQIKEVSGTDSFKFLEGNHRQGPAQSSIRLGLYYNDNLVSLMTFGKMRNSIGTGKKNLENTYELVRFCSVLDTNVIGAASKLFKHFVKEYQPEAVRSFSDRAHTKGTLYPSLGFREVARSTAGYVWVNVITNVAYHRTNAQKKNIQRFLNDYDIDLTQSEKIIMESHGFVRVFDSGTITWEWTKSNKIYIVNSRS